MIAEQLNGGLLRCSLQNNAEEGAVIMDSAMGTFAQCRVLNNRGPGLDISSSGRVSAKGCTISQNVGEGEEANTIISSRLANLRAAAECL